MRRIAILLATATAACSGHTAPSGSTPSPAARAAAEPSVLRYAAEAGRYRIEQTMNVVQEVMGQTNTMNANTSMFLSTAITAAAGGNLAATFTVDSVSVTGTPGIGEAFSSLRGKTYSGVYTPLGRNVSFASPESSAVAAQSGEMFREFLPLLPPGEITTGLSWTDTVNATQNNVPGVTTQTRAIREYRVVGWETRDSVRALRISVNGTYTISGSGEAQGQPLEMSGTGTAVGERFVSATGHFLGGTLSDSTSLTVHVLSAGLDIPVQQTRQSTVTRLP